MITFAFIDGQNLYAGIARVGWVLDFEKFRDYLTRHYGVTRAFYFIGYMPTQEKLYVRLRGAGYELLFKPVVQGQGHDPKGNIDADLVLQAMIEYPHYDKAVLVSGDGDFYSLVRYLLNEDKLRAVLSPNRRYCSALIKRESRGRLWFIEDLRKQLER